MAAVIRFVIALALASGLLSAQSPEMPAFDVASVKPNRSGGTGGLDVAAIRFVGQVR